MEQKLQPLFCIDAGESLTKIAQELGVGKQTVSNWKKIKMNLKIFVQFTLYTTSIIIFQDNVAASIANIKFEDIFSGEIPKFSETKKNKVLSKNGVIKKCNKVMNGEPSKKDEKSMQEMVEMVEKQKEEKLKVKEKRKEEKEKFSKFMKEWNKKKEDLELENLKVSYLHYL